MEQDGLAQLVRLHGWRLDGSQVESRFAVTEQLDAEFPAPSGEALRGRQHRNCGVDLEVGHGDSVFHSSSLSGARR